MFGTTAEYSPHTNLNFFICCWVFMLWSVKYHFYWSVVYGEVKHIFLQAVVDVDVTTFIECCCRCRGQYAWFMKRVVDVEVHCKHNIVLLRCRCLNLFFPGTLSSMSRSRSNTSLTSCCSVVDVGVTIFFNAVVKVDVKYATIFFNAVVDVDVNMLDLWNVLLMLRFTANMI